MSNKTEATFHGQDPERAEDGASAGGPADNECSCAMTEASQRTCPLHGEDDWRADTSEQGGEPR